MADRILTIHQDHRRSFADNRYVYAVVSRRSKGVSIGINLNPDKVCNFDCVYCQVDRTTPGGPRDVELPVLLAELEELLDLVASGALFEDERFRNTPEPLRRLNDIAFSGDGEPTTCPQFDAIVEAAAAVKERRGLKAVKMVLITNATQFHRPAVQHGMELLLAHNGEIWAKLEAGTDAYYHTIERTTIPFQRVLENITFAARMTPIVIQAMFLRMDGQPPSGEELEAFCGRLNDIIKAGGRIKLVQVYTVARKPAEATVSALSADEVDAIVELVRQRTRLNAEAYYGNA
jgi:wyosine [tRNA(Phe)-imidazoG37] synthetase (radical SAM superfamily)